MTAFLSLAVAAHGEVRLLRQCGEQADCMAVFGRGHLCSVLAYERRPLGRRLGLLPELHGFGARSQVREPHVVPVLACELGLRDASWRTPNGPDSEAFFLRPRGSEPHNTDNHRRSFDARRPTRAAAGSRRSQLEDVRSIEGLDACCELIHELRRAEHLDATLVGCFRHCSVASYQRPGIHFRDCHKDMVSGLQVWKINGGISLNERLVDVDEAHRILMLSSNCWCSELPFLHQSLERALNFEPTVRRHRKKESPTQQVLEKSQRIRVVR